jgi:hypothetical protein
MGLILAVVLVPLVLGVLMAYAVLRRDRIRRDHLEQAGRMRQRERLRARGTYVATTKSGSLALSSVPTRNLTS